MRIACLIIGIDGWEQYTRPLMESLQKYEPEARLVVIDNASQTPYPALPDVQRTERLCYAAAINRAAAIAGDADWYVVLSNDVLCQGPFAWILAQMAPRTIVGPQFHVEHGVSWLVGWCVACPGDVWAALGGWDEQFQVSSWEDVDFSVTAMEHGYHVACVAELPFMHLDQRQRFGLTPNYWESEAHNVAYFREKRRAAHGAH